MCWQAGTQAGRAATRMAGGPGPAPRYAGGGLTGVPHSAQNFAVALRSALQLVQCRCIGVPHESQNFAPARTWLWHAVHSIVAAGGGAGAVGAGAGAGGGAWTKPAPPPAKPGPGGGAG